MRLHCICSWHVNSISPISVFIRAHHCCSLVNESLAHQHDSIPNEEPRTQVALDKWAHFWHHGGECNDDAGCVWGFETDVHLIGMISLMNQYKISMEAKCIHAEYMTHISDINVIVFFTDITIIALFHCDNHYYDWDVYFHGLSFSTRLFLIRNFWFFNCSPPWMFVPLNILLEYWIEQVTFRLLYVKFVFPTRIFYKAVPDFATELLLLCMVL